MCVHVCVCVRARARACVCVCVHNCGGVCQHCALGCSRMYVDDACVRWGAALLRYLTPPLSPIRPSDDDPHLTLGSDAASHSGGGWGFDADNNSNNNNNNNNNNTHGSRGGAEAVVVGPNATPSHGYHPRSRHTGSMARRRFGMDGDDGSRVLPHSPHAQELLFGTRGTSRAGSVRSGARTPVSQA